MAEISISYVRADASFVSELARYLINAGHTVLSDYDDIRTPDNFIDHVRLRLRHVDCCLIILSKSSVPKLSADANPEGFLMAEIAEAVGYARARGKPLILPILIDEVPIPSV